MHEIPTQPDPSDYGITIKDVADVKLYRKRSESSPQSSGATGPQENRVPIPWPWIGLTVAGCMAILLNSLTDTTVFTTVLTAASLVIFLMVGVSPNNGEASVQTHTGSIDSGSKCRDMSVVSQRVDAYLHDLRLYCGSIGKTDIDVYERERMEERDAEEKRRREARVLALKLAEDRKRLRSEFWMSLGGHEFERELTTHLNRADWSASTTQASNDGGVDIEASCPNGTQHLIQCKRYKKPVGIGAIRDMYGAVTLHPAEAHGVVASPSGFTSGAVEAAKQFGIKLWDMEAILKFQAA